MPLSLAEKTQLQQEAQAVIDAVNALAVDPDVNPLQATVDALTAENNALKAKIDAARAAAQADKDADAANVSGQGVLEALA
jgi:hypothetical protein